MKYQSQISGFGPFPVIWLGQTLSMLGIGLSSFGLGVWVYQQTESVTQFALIAFFAALPRTLLSPLIGPLVDRWDRRKILMMSDGGAGLCTVILALLVYSGHLEIWHIYLLQAASSAFGSFNWPAMSAATTLLVSKRYLSRAAAMTQIGTATAQITSPLLAGILFSKIGLTGLIVINLATVLFSIFTLFVVRIPKPPGSVEGEMSQVSFRDEVFLGWNYIRKRPGLMALLLVVAATNFSLGIVQALITPLVLSFSSAQVLGKVLAVASCGVLAGGVLMSVWVAKRKISTILGALLIQGLILLLGGLRPNASLVAAVGFVFLFMSPVIYSCSQAIWQVKVPADIQGRVFAMRRFVAWSTTPLAYLAAGPLADHLFEPLLAPNGALANSVGRLIGVGEGRGIALLLILVGSFSVLAVSLGWQYRHLRKVESETPDAIAQDPEVVED